MLTVKETASRLNVSAASIYAMISVGKLGCHRIGVGRGAIRISEEHIAVLLESSAMNRGEATVRKPPRPRLKHLKL